jgi:signal transduction histidine kinase
MLFLILALPGQAAVPEIDAGAVHELLLSRHVMILEDQTAQLTLDDIRSGKHDAEFKAATRDFPGLNSPKARFWLKFSINNTSPESRQLLLENRYPMLDYMTLYQEAADGSLIEETLGDEVPYEKRTEGFRYPAYPLHLKPGLNHYIVKLQNRSTFVVSLFLWDQKSFQNYSRKDNLILGLLYGAIVVLVLYNMFLAISLRSQTYSIYVVYLIAYLCYQFGIQATGIVWIPGELGLWVMNHGWVMMVAVGHALSCLFAMQFLNMRKFMPRWKRWLQFLILVNVLVFGFCFVGSYGAITQATTYTTLIVSLTLIASGITAAWRGYRPAIYYTLGWTCLLLGNMALALMFNGLFPFNFFAQWGNLIGGAMEVALMSLALGSRVNDMQARSEQTIKSLNEALKKQIQEVESIVAERTTTIRSIIDHVKSGFFTINNRLEVEAGFTKSCHRLLGDRIQNQALLPDVLGLTGERRSIFQMTVQQVFADSMPEEVSLGQIPRTFRIGDSILILEGGLIRDENGKPKAILFTVNDITKLRMKQREAHRSSMLIKILRNMDAFRSFIKITRENLRQLAKPEIRSKKKMAAFILHTLKGNCLIFNMKAQADRIHRMEGLSKLSPADIEALERSFEQFLQRHADILGVDWDKDHDEDVVLKHSSLMNLREELTHLNLTPGFLQFFDDWVRAITARSAGSLLGPIVDDVQLLARRCGRKVDFELRGTEVKIHSEQEKQLMKNLVHLVRNAVIHGIEQNRGTKPAKGRILLQFEESQGQLEIRCQDDGQGMDRKAIVQMIIEKGLASGTDIEKKSIAELMDILSQDGYSSTAEVDIYSGRGVGVASVYGAVRACQGTLEITTERGQGTTFIITLPRSEASGQTGLKAV